MQNLVNNEFEQNANGHYSHLQTRSLILWFIRLVFIFCIGGLVLAYNMSNIWSIIVALVSTVILFFNVWQYSADLLLSVPTFTVGNVSKEIRQFRGPKRYDLLIGEDEMRVRALNKMQWQLVQDGMNYKIYYSPRTKWLLSFEQLTDE